MGKVYVSHVSWEGSMTSCFLDSFMPLILMRKWMYLFDSWVWWRSVLLRWWEGLRLHRVYHFFGSGLGCTTLYSSIVFFSWRLLLLDWSALSNFPSTSVHTNKA